MLPKMLVKMSFRVLSQARAASRPKPATNYYYHALGESCMKAVKLVVFDYFFKIWDFRILSQVFFCYILIIHPECFYWWVIRVSCE